MLLPFLVVAIASSGDDEEEQKPKERRVVADLLSPEATTRDYRAASEEQQERFIAHFTRVRLGDAEPVAMAELRRHLNSKLASLPATGESMDVMKAAMGSTSLWEAAEYAAKNLGWPQR